MFFFTNHFPIELRTRPSMLISSPIKSSSSATIVFYGAKKLFKLSISSISVSVQTKIQISLQMYYDGPVHEDC